MTNMPPRSSAMAMPIATVGHAMPITLPFSSNQPNRVFPMTSQDPLQKTQASIQPNPYPAVTLNADDSQSNQSIATSSNQQEYSKSSDAGIIPAPLISIIHKLFPNKFRLKPGPRSSFYVYTHLFL